MLSKSARSSIPSFEWLRDPHDGTSASRPSDLRARRCGRRTMTNCSSFVSAWAHTRAGASGARQHASVSIRTDTDCSSIASADGAAPRLHRTRHRSTISDAAVAYRGAPTSAFEKFARKQSMRIDRRRAGQPRKFGEKQVLPIPASATPPRQAASLALMKHEADHEIGGRLIARDFVARTNRAAAERAHRCARVQPLARN